MLVIFRLFVSTDVVPTCAHELPLGSVGADVLHPIQTTSRILDIHVAVRAAGRCCRAERDLSHLIGGKSELRVRDIVRELFGGNGFVRELRRCDVAGVTGSAYTESDFGNSGSTKTYYFTGLAAPGASIKVVVGVKVDNSTQEISFTAPELLGPTVYIKVGGAWKKASKVYVKSSGAWKEGQLKINVGGAWK